MSLSLIIGLLVLALVVIFAAGAFRRSGQTPSGTQSMVIVLVLIVIVALLLFRVLG